MTIGEISVQRLLSLYDTTWSLRKLNIVIGPNSSGKSNLVTLIELIKNAAAGSLSPFIQKQGGINSLSWDGCLEEIKIKTFLNDIWDSKAQNYSAAVYNFSLAGPFMFGKYQITNEYFSLYEYGTGKKISDLQLINKNIQAEFPGLEQTAGLNPPQDETILSRHPTSFDQPEIAFQWQFISSAWSVNRGFRTDASSPVRQSTITRHETSVSSDGDNLISVLHTLYTNDKSFKEIIDISMNAAFNGTFEEIVFPPAADQRVQLGIRWKGLKKVRSSASLSDGTLRFLYLLTILENPNPPALMVIEEPEAGLHPSMLTIIAESAVDASRRTQVVFTTHSPEFLDAFHDTLPAVTVCTADQGKTNLKTLDGDKLDYWMKSYTLGEFHRSGAAEAVR
ncbi:MAG TPA: AAA family ATPase [Candidatus Hydrogenedentes bacterium]|nr:AAA family ATPase [Candidatus Hydrogenedentota bacterium]